MLISFPKNENRRPYDALPAGFARTSAASGVSLLQVSRKTSPLMTVSLSEAKDLKSKPLKTRANSPCPYRGHRRQSRHFKKKTGEAPARSAGQIFTSLLRCFFTSPYSVYTLGTLAVTAHIKSEVTVPIPRATAFVANRCSPYDP